MSGRGIWLIGMLLPVQLHAQVRPDIDSLGIASAIAKQVLADSEANHSRPFVVDTESSPWAALVYHRLHEQAPNLVPRMSDSVAHFATHLAMTVVMTGGDTLSTSLVWSSCYAMTRWASTRRTWQVIRQPSGWMIRVEDWIATGDGICAPYSPTKGGG